MDTVQHVSYREHTVNLEGEVTAMPVRMAEKHWSAGEAPAQLPRSERLTGWQEESVGHEGKEERSCLDCGDGSVTVSVP